MGKINCKIYDCPELDIESELCNRDEVEITDHGCSIYRQFKIDRKAQEIGVKLEPCPFCGGEAELLYDSIGNGCYVICKGCLTMTDRKKDVKEAVDTWNTRASNN